MAKEERIVLSRSVRIAAKADLTLIDAAVRSVGGTTVWHSDSSLGRRYGTLEGSDAGNAVTRTSARAVVFETSIIALAVTPSTPEALPLLEVALAGSGRPSGVLGCDRVGDSVIVEWDPQRTSVAVVLEIIDLELRRLRASRVIRVLTPLPLAWIAQIAAEGLHAPQITADLVLEERLHQCNVVD